MTDATNPKGETLSRREMLEVTAAAIPAPVLKQGPAADQRVAVLTRIAAGEQDPKTPAEHFFQELKRSTVRAYYTSKVGIHADQQYKGNVYQRGEFAGFDAK